MKITKIVTHPTEIWRILTKIGWPTTTSEFDEPQDLVEWDICQMVPGTADGFPDEYDHSHKSGTDPPECSISGNYFSVENIDPPHWEENYIQYD